MKVLMVWKYYPKYLAYFYRKYPFVADLPFDEHRNKIFDDHFGWPAELNQYMNQKGIHTEFIIANAESLQKKWAEENDFKFYSEKNWEKQIAMEQIRRFQPDILWITSIFDYFGDFVKCALTYCKRAITWVSCAIPKNLDVSGFTTLVTSHPEMLQKKQHLFNKVIVTKPGFDAEILKKIGPIEKKYDVIFIGGISAAHAKRVEILAYLIKKGVDLNMFGYLPEQQLFGIRGSLKQATKHILNRRDFHKGVDVLKQSFVNVSFQRNFKIIKSIYQSPVFGLDMYKTLAASRLMLNIHIDVANNHAGNMRMFEATGTGACLLTEHFKNINDLFKPRKEILTYKSKEELLEIIKKMLKQNETVEQIAQAGQKRTLQSHTLEKMFNDIKPAITL